MSSSDPTSNDGVTVLEVKVDLSRLSSDEVAILVNTTEPEVDRVGDRALAKATTEGLKRAKLRNDGVLKISLPSGRTEDEARDILLKAFSAVQAKLSRGGQDHLAEVARRIGT